MEDAAAKPPTEHERWWQKLLPALKAIYVAFLEGKVVCIPGASSVTQTQPRDEKRRVQKPPRDDGLPEPVDPAPPLSTSALGFVLFVLTGVPITVLTVVGVLKWRTASMSRGTKPRAGAMLRASIDRAAGKVFLSTVAWVALIAALAWGGVHAFR